MDQKTELSEIDRLREEREHTRSALKVRSYESTQEAVDYIVRSHGEMEAELQELKTLLNVRPGEENSRWGSLKVKIERLIEDQKSLRQENHDLAIRNQTQIAKFALSGVCTWQTDAALAAQHAMDVAGHLLALEKKKIGS